MSKSAHIEQFIESRPELANARKIMLRYLAEVSDKIELSILPKGRSKVKCYFDCGAYKGDEILEFRVSSLNPLSIALNLMNLTSGHHFSYGEVEKLLLQTMKERIKP